MSKRRITPAAVVLLVLATLFCALTVTVAYGFAVEYGDTAAGRWQSAIDGVRWWWFGVAIVAVLTLGALRLASGSLVVRSATVVLVLGSLVGTGAGAAIGTEQKLSRYPAVPRCTAEFTSGPAVLVVRSAQAAFEELDHPAPFSGGGSSGVDGCSSEVMVADGVDPRPAYRRTLAAHGWRLESDRSGRLRAVRGRQAFELSPTDGMWIVWIGPDRLDEQPLDEGEVGPRG
jgi:hypothetical protein